MIIFQIIAGLLLIPLTALLFILFNLYLINRIYLLFISFFFFIYAALCGLVFLNFSIAAWVFMILVILYVIRMSYLATKLRAKNKGKNYPLVRGKISSREDKFHVIFLFPLSFLKIFKLMPNFISREIIRKTRLDIELSELVDLILDCCIGTQVDIASNDGNLFFEIK